MAESMQQPLERVPTGIENLDIILNGGFLRGGVYMIVGTPGAGKTILGNQIAFSHAAQGNRVVFMTLLAESHARMLAHLSTMSFVNRDVVGDNLYYISGYATLEQDGLDGLFALIRNVLRERQATTFIIDGLTTIESTSTPELNYRRFLHELQVLMETLGCTAFLLTQPGRENTYPEHTMVDGLLKLTNRLVGPRAVRELEVSKLRGTDYLRGIHAFEITNDGIQVHPRTEALLANPSPTAQEVRTRLATGIAGLDQMLHGGIVSGSTTVLLGAPGSGKTVIGLHFLRQATQKKENALYFGFFETPSRLIDKARQLHLPLEGQLSDNKLEIIWQPPLEDDPDALVEQILTAVRRRNVSRLFIDGLEPIQEALVYPERTGLLFTALMNELRTLGVTTIFSAELPDLFSPRVAIPVDRVSSIVDNVIFVRYVELHSQLYRLISVLKMRESEYDPSIREFTIASNGIEVASTFESAEAILTGIARPLPYGFPQQSQPPNQPPGKESHS